VRPAVHRRPRGLEVRSWIWTRFETNPQRQRPDGMAVALV